MTGGAPTDGHRLTVIVPTLNEAPCISQVLDGLLAQSGIDEILVVDGGSTDETQALVRQKPSVILYVQKKPGFGPGLYEAFGEASGDLLCIVDADGSHNWRDIPQMRRIIAQEGADYVLGSRYRGEFRFRGPLRWPWSTSDDDSMLHEWGNLAIVGLARVLHRYPLSDVMMGLQMWRRSILPSLGLEEESQAFEAEFKLRIHRAGYVMREIPTREFERIGGEAKLDAWTDGVSVGKVLLREWARAGFRWPRSDR